MVDHRKSLGVIDISEGPIRWVNVRELGPDVDGNAAYYADFGVPDPKVTAGFPKVRIKSEKVKTSWFFGKVIDIGWKGKDYGLGVIDRLQSDRALRDLATNRSDDVRITALPDEGCWVISYGVWASTGAGNHRLPSILTWSSYKAIALHLLEATMALASKQKSGSGSSERLKLVEDWLDYLFRSADRGKAFIVFQSENDYYVQFAFDGGRRKVRAEVGALEWEEAPGGSIPESAARRLIGKGFNRPEGRLVNYWQDFDQSSLRSLAQITEWVFREVFGENHRFTMRVSDFKL